MDIEIPDLLMKLISCLGFLKNINYVVILKCPKRMMENYFSTVFTILECNYNNLAKLPNEVKYKIHAEERENSYKFMVCITKIPSTSNTLTNLVVNKSLHISYIPRKFNDKMKIIINIFSSYVVPPLKHINHP